MEEGLGKVLTQGIELGWPEEGDRGEGATSRRAVELRSALDAMRRKRELTSGSHNRPDKYLAMPRGLSANLERTVRESGVTSTHCVSSFLPDDLVELRHRFAQLSAHDTVILSGLSLVSASQSVAEPGLSRTSGRVLSIDVHKLTVQKIHENINGKIDNIQKAPSRSNI